MEAHNSGREKSLFEQKFISFGKAAFVFQSTQFFIQGKGLLVGPLYGCVYKSEISKYSSRYKATEFFLPERDNLLFGKTDGAGIALGCLYLLLLT